MPMSGLLPLVGQERPERADAAANREKVLAAAEALFTRCDPATVSMEAVASAAGVGKGTLFRRFGDRAGLARAVLGRHEIAFQEAIIRGAPPLGPGAPPLERLIAFGAAYLDFLESHGTLLREAEGSHEAFLHSDVYAFYRMHVTLLLREAGVGERPEFFADVVMFPLAATAHRYFRGRRALSRDDLQAAHADLCTRLLTSSR
jgi:AcrR family transcriptional regulator